MDNYLEVAGRMAGMEVWTPNLREELYELIDLGLRTDVTYGLTSYGAVNYDAITGQYAPTVSLGFKPEEIYPTPTLFLKSFAYFAETKEELVEILNKNFENSKFVHFNRNWDLETHSLWFGDYKIRAIHLPNNEANRYIKEFVKNRK
jgi:hypothetical protein